VRPLPDGDEPSTYALLERDSGSGTQDRRENALASVPRPAVKDASVSVPGAAVIAADEATEVAKGQSVTRYGGAESPVDAALLSAPDTLTKYSQLAGYVGRDLTVYEHGRQPVRVKVVRVVDSGDVLVRRNLIGGNIEYVLERSRFDHAEQ